MVTAWRVSCSIATLKTSHPYKKAAPLKLARLSSVSPKVSNQFYLVTLGVISGHAWLLLQQSEQPWFGTLGFSHIHQYCHVQAANMKAINSKTPNT